MTAIAGIIDKEKGITYLASDRMASNGFIGENMKNKKVFKNGIISMASCGSIRVRQILKHNLSPRNFQVEESVEQYVYGYLEKEIREKLRERNCLKVREEVQELVNSEIIIAIKDRLFVLQEDLALFEPELIYVTSGSGAYHQQASIHTQLQMDPKKDKKQILRDAILYTGQIVLSVGGDPIIIEHKH
jgi:hypothetical protein